VAGKARAKAADQRQIGGAHLAGLGECFASRSIDQVEASACRFVAQATLARGNLQTGPVARFDEGFRDEKPKAHEERLVDDFVTPRLAALGPLHFQPHQIAQYRTGCFIPLAAQRHEPLPQGIIAMKKGLGHDRDPSISGLRNP
jgi:hypothetical protein